MLLGLRKDPSRNKWFRYRLQICVFSGLVIEWWSKLQAAHPYPIQSWVSPPPGSETSFRMAYTNLKVKSSVCWSFGSKYMLFLVDFTFLCRVNICQIQLNSMLQSCYGIPYWEINVWYICMELISIKIQRHCSWKVRCKSFAFYYYVAYSSKKFWKWQICFDCTKYHIVEICLYKIIVKK